MSTGWGPIAQLRYTLVRVARSLGCAQFTLARNQHFQQTPPYLVLQDGLHDDSPVAAIDLMRLTLQKLTEKHSASTVHNLLT